MDIALNSEPGDPGSILGRTATQGLIITDYTVLPLHVNGMTFTSFPMTNLNR